MSTTATLRFSAWQRISWPRPEWWTIALCVGGWLLILLRANAGAGEMHASHHAAVSDVRIGPTWMAQIFWWLVMVVAMMFPLLVDPIRNTAARSLWNRRHRAIGLFLGGYLAPWLAFGIAASLALSATQVQTWLRPSIVVALSIGVALIWQLTPVKRRSVLGCHRTRPLAPVGWRADRDCLHYGWMIGSWCMVSCWGLMLACMLSNHSLLVMVGFTAISWVERNKARPNQLLLCGVIVMIGLIFAIV